MTVISGQPPDHFQIALRALTSIEGCEPVGDWTWYEPLKSWALLFRLDIGTKGTALIPQLTEWYALVADRYPLGKVRVYPAIARGITHTFQHQHLNRPWEPYPWTKGDICTDIPGFTLDRLVPGLEPSTVAEKLAWHINRAKTWVKAAATNDLERPGEHFELPHFPVFSPNHQKFAFSEGSDDIATWASSVSKTGLVRLAVSAQGKYQRIVPLAFLDRDNNVLMDLKWGHFLTQATPVLIGGWIRLPKIPVISPWQAPASWAELSDIVTQMGVNFMETMATVCGSLRDGQEHILLIGFPIPEVIGGAPSLMHWQAISLPRLSTIQDAKQGFRPTNLGAMRRDFATILGWEKPLEWLESDNWNRRSFGARGQLKSAHEIKTVIIGIGAVGSAVAEMLVRGGVENLVLIDGDDIEPGNLVRHTLTSSDEGKNKAIAIAERLNGSSPHARVDAIDRDIDPDEPKCRTAIEQADLVIDCTGNNDVLDEIHAFSWKETATFVSLAIGIHAERIYIYAAPGWSFSARQFRQVVNPLIQQDYDLHPGFVLPQEGAGCWHPLFPARSHDIWFMSSLAVRELEELMGAKLDGPELRLITFDGQLHREVIRPSAL